MIRIGLWSIAVLLPVATQTTLGSRVARANLNPPNDVTQVLLKAARMPDPEFHPPELEEWLEDCDFIDTMMMNKPPLPISMQTKPYKLGDAVARFQADGFVTLRKVISPRELRHRVRIHNKDGKDRTVPLSKALPVCAKAVFDSRAIYGERSSTFESFFRIHNLWRSSRFLRQLVFSPRFAKIAAGLMGVSAVKLYQDSLFVKQAGHNSSRWHQDHVAAPFARNEDNKMQMVTMWLPLQKATNDNMGLLRFAAKSHLPQQIFMSDTPGDGNTIGTLSDENVRSLFTVEGAAQLITKQQLRLGDASFHDGFTLHGSGPNLSSETRWALAVQYVAADITALTRSTFDRQQPESPDPLSPIGLRVGDDRYSFREWLHASEVFGDVIDMQDGSATVMPVEHPHLPVLWSRDLDARQQYLKAQGFYENFQVGTWRPSDADIRPCPLDQLDWKNKYGDGCETYKEHGPAHDYCISDGQEAYLHCASSCETMCRSTSFYNHVLKRSGAMTENSEL